MKQLFSWTPSLKNFISQQQGSAMPFVALGIMMLIGAAGTAIDMGRLQIVQTRMQNALDATGLAVGSEISTVNVNTETSKYFYANFPANYLSTNITSLTTTPNADNSVINLAVAGTMNTTFMKVFGISTMSVSATSQITRGNKGMELALVLDITGSMWTNNNYLALRTATSDLLDILYGNNDTQPNLWVGVVPYVTGVNIGSQSQAKQWLTSYDLTKYPPSYPNTSVKWKGCVEERASPADLTDDPPVQGGDATSTATRFPMYFWPSNQYNNNWYNSSTGQVTIYDAYNYSNDGGLGPNISCGDPVVALTASKSTVKNYTNALYPWRKSGTMSSEGMVWGWRMLSPKWRGLWDADAVGGQTALPLDYNTPLMIKAAVIETDGYNNFYNTYQSQDGGTPPPYSDYTPYLALNTVANGGRPDINTQSTSAGNTIIDNKTLQVCAAMKAKGIIVYTVTFYLDGSSAANNARAVFKACASKPEYYFDADSRASGATQINLDTAFKTIGDSLANLRISQ